MKQALLVLPLLFVFAGIYMSQLKEKQRKQELVGISEKKHWIYQNVWISRFLERAKKQAEYTNHSLHKMTLLSLLLMIPGSLLGIFFRNTELGLLLSITFASLPFVFLFASERKKQRLILQGIVPFLTSLDWAYVGNSFSIPKTLQQIESSCPEVIRKEYHLMLQKIHTGVEPGAAMSELADQTRSPIFKVLAGILMAQQKRNDPEAFRQAIKQLMNDVIKTNNRVSKVTATMQKKGAMLIMVVMTTIGIYWATYMMMREPVAYFTSPAGATSLLVGTVALLIPVSIYFMSLLRRRF